MDGGAWDVIRDNCSEQPESNKMQLVVNRMSRVQASGTRKDQVFQSRQNMAGSGRCCKRHDIFPLSRRAACLKYDEMPNVIQIPAFFSWLLGENLDPRKMMRIILLNSAKDGTQVNTILGAQGSCDLINRMDAFRL